MINLDTWKKAWALLDGRERRNALIVLGVVILSALSSAVMVSSIMPFLAVLADPSRIQTSKFLLWLYDVGGFKSDFTFLIGLGVGSISIILAVNLLLLVRVYVVARFTLMRMHSISQQLLSNYLRQPYEFFLNRHSGEMGTQILAESQQVVQQFIRPAADAIASGFMILSIIALLFVIDPIVSLVAFGILGGIYGSLLLFSRSQVRRLGNIRAAANKARFRNANEALAGVKLIKLMGLEKVYAKRYSKVSQRMAHAVVLANFIRESPQYVMQILAFGGMILLCILLLDPTGLDRGDTLSDILPLLGVFAFAGMRLMPELSRLYMSLNKLQFGSAAVEAVYEDLNQRSAPRLDSAPSNDQFHIELTRELQLDRISYTYPNAGKPGLINVSLTIHRGEKIGIVGSTGAGKTTLADIILGLLQPGSGQMLVDGVEIKDGKVRNWQNKVGYVPQDIFLIDASVAENIAFGERLERIDRARVKAAARTAHIHDHIVNELPSGYETTVGERGVRLSGGQRQRIGVARALYHDASLIVFDEATSALDNLTERDVMAAIEALPGDKTVLLIAHRLTTVKGCDRIVVLKAGSVDAVGTWEELNRGNSEFQALTQSAELA